MLRRSVKIMLATGGIVAVLGTGVAVAADPPVCPWGNTPQSTSATQPDRDRTQQRLRQRDGTGPRHAQQVQQRRSGNAQAPGRGAGNGGASCPYRR
jgi:hypothetical protein